VISVPTVPGYEAHDVIGQGGFGTVYRARQLAVGREVALKVDNRVLATERDRRRFLREVSAAGHLSGHPNVIDLYDAGTLPDGRPYLVSELCPGGSLDSVLHRQGPLAAAQVREIGLGIADALAAAHAAGVLHRDVKPANILINRYAVAGLSDFGLASILDADGAQSATREALTPAYAAPEAFELADPAPAADVYSLAATLYALLCGQPPRFSPGMRPSIAMIMRLHQEPVPDIVGVPRALVDVLRAGLVADPAQRLPSAAALRDALATVRLEDLVDQQPGPNGVVPEIGVPAGPTGDPWGATTADGVPPAVPTQAGRPHLPPSHPSGPGPWPTAAVLSERGTGVLPVPAGARPPAGRQEWPAPAWPPSASVPAPRRRRLGLVAGLAVLGLVGSGLLLALGPGRGLFRSQSPGSSSSSGSGSGSGSGSTVPASTSGAPKLPASGSTPATSQASVDGGTGAAAILAAVNAYRQAVGGADPSAVEMTFYPSPGPTEQAWAIATLPSRVNPAIADEYRYSDGAVQAPTPPVIQATDVAALSWHFSAVAWSKTAAMLQTTDRICRAAMKKANRPDKQDEFGGRAGISHVIIERDTAFHGGKVVIRVYFDGGAYWDGGYVPFYADGTKITDSYCTTP
jgi:serine/threonine protein kinase